jgi:hypothetical protein
VSYTTNALDDLLLVEVVVYDPNIPGTATKYYSTGQGHTTGPAETPANTTFEPRVKQAVDIRRTMFAPKTTRGRSTVGLGAIVLLNGDGELDDFAHYGVDGRAITIRSGPAGAAYPSGFTTVFVGTMQNVEVTQDEIRLLLRDRQVELNVPLQTTKYTGAGLGTLEGTADDIQGKPKPVLWGSAYNFAPICVETAKLIYQVSDATVNTSAANHNVYDRGVGLTAVAGYASTADLLDNALAPAAGEYKVYSGAEGAYFRLGSQPDGQVTADFARSVVIAEAGLCFEFLMNRAGFSGAEIGAPDSDTFIGWWQGAEETTVAAMLDRVAESVLAAWFTDQSGVFQFKVLAAPEDDAAVMTFTENDILRDKQLTRIASNDPGQGVPAYETVVRYKHYQTVQTTDVAAAVTQARREDIGNEWRTVVDSTDTVQTAYPLARSLTIDSMVFSEADASGVAVTSQTLFGRIAAYSSPIERVPIATRQFFEFTVKLDDDTIALELNDVIELVHPRYHLALVGGTSGALFRILGLAMNGEDRELTITAWGPDANESNWVDDEGDYMVTDEGDYLVFEEAA